MVVAPVCRHPDRMAGGARCYGVRRIDTAHPVPPDAILNRNRYHLVLDWRIWS